MNRILLLIVLVLATVAAFGADDVGSSNAIRPAPPSGISVPQLIERFAAKEKEFKDAREHYTWRQSVKVETLDGNTPDGEYQMVSDILFDDRGRRVENVVYAPMVTLTRVSMTKED